MPRDLHNDRMDKKVIIGIIVGVIVAIGISSALIFSSNLKTGNVNGTATTIVNPPSHKTYTLNLTENMAIKQVP